MVRHSRENLEIWLLVHILAKRHNRRYIATPVAVVGRRPDGHDVFGGEVIFIAFIHQLVCASYEFEVVDVVELDIQVNICGIVELRNG